MSACLVQIRELAAWGLDPNEYRPDSSKSRLTHATASVARRRFNQSNVLLTPEFEDVRELFDTCAKRPDLLAEMSGLSWSLGVVDLRSLIAFQRRLVLHPGVATTCNPGPRDWPALFALCFGPPKQIEYTMTHNRSIGTLVLQSANPDLHLRPSRDPATPLTVHAGGPFMEVACFRNRWFLRDGYHRAYALLQSGVFVVPAVIVHAATIEQLGADHASFFPEQVLFSERPPQVADFLDQDLVLEYERAPFLKTIRIHVEETLSPATRTGEQR